jgi:M6 family metalloprotease-like protein
MDADPVADAPRLTYGRCMRCGAGVAVLAISCALLTAATAAPSTASAALPPPPDSVLIPPHPPVQGQPGKTPNLPCGVLGPALDLGDSSHYARPLGTLRAVMLFVDFSDAPASAYPGTSPQEAFDRLVPSAEATINTLSYGKLHLSVTPSAQWIRMPKPLSAYGLEDNDPQDQTRHRRYLRDAIRAADPSFDFSKVKLVYVMAGPGAEKRGGTSNFPPGEGVKVDGTRIEHVMTLNAYGDGISTGIVVHETGHILGLPDFYDVYKHQDQWDHFIGPWDVMSNAFASTTMLSWTRRLVGWLSDRDFRCVRHQATVTLAPVAAADGLKGVVVRTGRRRAYVVEARSRTEAKSCPDAGVLIYRVNGGVATGEGPIHVIDATPGIGDCGDHTAALFKPPGAGVAHYEDSKIAVTVLPGDDSPFRVRVRALQQK